MEEHFQSFLKAEICLITSKARMENIFVLFSSMYDVNRKHSQTSKSLINFQGKIIIFKEIRVPLKLHFKFQHFQGVLN